MSSNGLLNLYDARMHDILVVLACGESWSGVGRIAQFRRVNLAECTDCFHFEANMATCLIASELGLGCNSYWWLQANKLL